MAGLNRQILVNTSGSFRPSGGPCWHDEVVIAPGDIALTVMKAIISEAKHTEVNAVDEAKTN